MHVIYAVAIAGCQRTSATHVFGKWKWDDSKFKVRYAQTNRKGWAFCFAVRSLTFPHSSPSPPGAFLFAVVAHFLRFYPWITLLIPTTMSPAALSLVTLALGAARLINAQATGTFPPVPLASKHFTYPDLVSLFSIHSYALGALACLCNASH